MVIFHRFLGKFSIALPFHHLPSSGASRIGHGGRPGHSGGATRFLHGRDVVAAAGGGSAGGRATGALRFAPGGRGGSGGSVAKADVVPGGERGNFSGFSVVILQPNKP